MHPLLKRSKLPEHIKDNIEHYGYTVVDEAEVGGYDLVLTHFPLLNCYHLALQAMGQDFSSPEQQMTKIPGAIKGNMLDAIPVIDRWVKQYGELWVGGNNPSKMPVYRKILERLGYPLEDMDCLGLKLLVISKPSNRVHQSDLLKRKSK
jgi:hypothetical protein